MRTFKEEIDHIDPRWKEGRDYQLVCGLDCPLNYREEDWKRNTLKSNRFLPWRWCRDEIGVVPEEPGDFAYFLVGANIEKDIPGEWVLMEFLSDEWFEATRQVCGNSAAGSKSRCSKEQYSAAGSVGQPRSVQVQRERNTGIFGRYQCTITGKVSTAACLKRWQLARGIDPSNRIKIN